MTQKHWLTPWRIGCACILALSGFLYLGALTGALIWDDHFLLSGQAIGGGESFLHCFSKPFLENYYRPLVSASFYLERMAAGRTPFFYHQTNLLIHILTTWAVIAMLWEAFRRRSVALIGGLLFAAQPVQVSAVAWIGGRTDALCALWMALFGWTLIRAVREAGGRRLRWMAVSVLAFAGALFTKEQVLPAFLLVPLAFRCWDTDSAQNPRAWATRAWKAAIPFLFVIALFVSLSLLFGPPPPERVKDTLPYVLASTARAVTYYALLLFVPTPAVMHTTSLGAFVRAGIWPILAGVGVIVLIGLLFRRWLRTEPAAAWFLAFSVLTLVMVSNLYPVPSALVTPYRACVAGIGAAGLLGWGIGVRWRGDGHLRPRTTLIGAAAAGIFVCWFTGLTVWGVGKWQKEEGIARTMVQYDPDSIFARYNLSTALLTQHRRAEALAELEALFDRLFESPAWRSGEAVQQALRQDRRLGARIHEIEGTRITTKEWLASLYAQLGFARLDNGDSAGAHAVFQIGLAMNLRSLESNLGMGYCAELAGDYLRAERYLRRVLLMDPHRIDAHTKLGKVYVAEGKWMPAREEFAACVREQPWAGQAYLELANTQWHLGDIPGAITTLRAALRQSPNRRDVRAMLFDIEHGRPRPDPV